MGYDPTTYRYPIQDKNGAIRIGSFKAALKAHGVPDAHENPGKAITLLNQPGSRARVKWAGDAEFTQYGEQLEFMEAKNER